MSFQQHSLGCPGSHLQTQPYFHIFEEAPRHPPKPSTNTVQTQTLAAEDRNLFDYQSVLLRFKEDNEELRSRLHELESANSDLLQQLSEVSHEKAAWLRIEAQLKDKIHSL